MAEHREAAEARCSFDEAILTEGILERVQSSLRATFSYKNASALTVCSVMIYL
ncbi:hypothetical protein CY34DRAFT_813474 [Suillus luteus UH-Slu-Lm8-n1]|uniref:Unplaced genomic scaffold CY34scaffold_764, whole genome shotgun sequence n=1 Tax=Suillus luteus UH-Slu-Lm8-n1 TaxID=930992 RepID=A0A0D0A604_9AGAM|nr:hypothetical protein CY34DRAFT_813474 [Suillus luteus UH-Slu-Lm8-n1]